MEAQLDEAFRRDASLLPQQIDIVNDHVLLVRLGEQDYRDASFLDQRLLTPDRGAQWAPWAALEGIPLPDRAGPDFIFHIGHVGSTLVSRLLGELPGCLGVREPQLLRSLAELGMLRGRPESPWPPDLFAPRLATASRWLGRGFAPDQRALVKATSFVGEIAGDILAVGGRALALFLTPQRYIETILGGENSRRELAMLAGSRLVRLHRRIGAEPWRLWELPEATRAALAWACEMAALEDAAARAPERVLWIDFDDFLARPASALAEAAGFLGHDLAAEEAAKLVDGPLMGRYSKAPEHAYSPALREQVLAEARRQHGPGIAAAMRWLEAAAADHEVIARAMARTSGRD